eukprot:3786149-Rhodomonas_salina.1
MSLVVALLQYKCYIPTCMEGRCGGLQRVCVTGRDSVGRVESVQSELRHLFASCTSDSVFSYPVRGGCVVGGWGSKREECIEGKHVVRVRGLPLLGGRELRVQSLQSVSDAGGGTLVEYDFEIESGVLDAVCGSVPGFSGVVKGILQRDFMEQQRGMLMDGLGLVGGVEHVL